MTLIIWVVEAQYYFTLKIQNQDARVLLAVENAHLFLSTSVPVAMLTLRALMFEKCAHLFFRSYY